MPIEGREQHLRKYLIYKDIIIMLKGKNKSLVKIAIESAFYTRRNISMCHYMAHVIKYYFNNMYILCVLINKMLKGVIK